MKNDHSIDLRQGSGLALVATLFQVALLYACSGFRYLKGVHWDGVWYFNILTNGYRTEFPPQIVGAEGSFSNVGFFPAYPVLSAILKKVLFLNDPAVALLITSQLCTFLFWLGFFILLMQAGVPIKRMVLAAVFCLVQPGAFFFAAAYSESLLMGSFLWFVIFFMKSSEQNKYFVLTAVAGMLLTATKLVGSVLSISFVFTYLGILWAQKFTSGVTLLTRKVVVRSLLILMFSALGLVSFLAFCEIKFDAWNLYWITVKEGWHVKILWENVLQFSRIYNPAEFIFRVDHSEWVGRLVLLGHPVLFGICTWALYRLRKTRHFNHFFALYVATLMLAVATWVGRTNKDFYEFTRYFYGVTTLLVLVITPSSFLSKPPIWIKGFYCLCCTVLLGIQLFLAYRFSHGFWVG